MVAADSPAASNFIINEFEIWQGESKNGTMRDGLHNTQPRYGSIMDPRNRLEVERPAAWTQELVDLEHEFGTSGW